MNTFIVVLIVIVMLVGLFMLIQFMRSKTYKGDDKSLEYKNNLPILPRAERVDAVVEPEPSNDDIKINLGDEDALSRLAHAAENSSNQSQQTINHQTMAGEREGRDILTTVKHTFDSNSPILDHHLNKEENFEQNNDPLLNAKDTVTLFITPYNHTVGISGKEVMNLIRSYGLKFGVMGMYHRYEDDKEGTGILWFSMLGVGRDGNVQDFDPNTLPEQRFSGLSLFLSLPHPHAYRAYKVMVSTARSFARALHAEIHDEGGYTFNDEDFDKLGIQVANYQPEQ